MALKPKHSWGELSREWDFVDRTTHIDRFERALMSTSADQQVFVFFGCGGIGKSYLAKELLRRVSYRERILSIHHDFDISARTGPEALQSMRSQLERHNGVRFPSFDEIYDEYWAREWSGATRAARRTAADHRLVRGATQTVEAMTNLPLEIARETVRDIAVSASKSINHKARPELGRIGEMSTDELAEWLVTAWASDLHQHCVKRGQRPVIFLDTYETIWTSGFTHHRAQAKDEWVRELIASLPGAILVVFSREIPPWPEGDVKDVVESRQLDPLDEPFCREVLERRGVTDPDVVAAILGVSEGHPYRIGLAADSVLLLYAKGLPATASDIGGTPQELYDRFVKHLDQTEVEALRVLSCLRGFDRDLGVELSTAVRAGVTPGRLRDLTRFSFVESDDGIRYTIHSLMRSALQDHFQATDRKYWLDVHESALQIFTERFRCGEREVLVSSFDEAAYHAWCINGPEDFGEWVAREAQTLMEAGMIGAIEPVLSSAVERLEMSSDKPRSLYRVQLLHAYALSEQARLPEARRIAEELHANAIDVFGSDSIFVAECSELLAYVLRRLGDTERSEQHYRAALKTRRAVQGERHPDVATTMVYLSYVLRRDRRNNEAEWLLRTSLEITAEVFGPDSPAAASVMSALGAHIFKTEAGPGEARALLRRALAIDMKCLGESHPRCLIAMGRYAAALYSARDYVAAHAEAERAIRLADGVFGQEHPSRAKTLVILAQSKHALGMTADAIALLEQGIAVIEEAYDTDSALLCSLLSALCTCHIDAAGQPTSDALRHQERLLALLIKNFPPTDTRIATTRYRLIEILLSLKSNDRAYEELVNLVVEAAATGRTADPRARAMVEARAREGLSAESIETLEGVRSRLTSTPDLPDEARAAGLHEIARLHIATQQHETAIALLAEAESLCSTDTDTQLAAFIAADLAAALSSVDRHAEALPHLERFVRFRITHEQRDLSGLRSALHLLSYEAEHRGTSMKDNMTLVQLAASGIEGAQLVDATRILCAAAWDMSKRGEHAHAVALAELGYRVANYPSGPNDKLAIASAAADLGSMLRRGGQAKAARGYATEAMNLYRDALGAGDARTASAEVEVASHLVGSSDATDLQTAVELLGRAIPILDERSKTRRRDYAVRIAAKALRRMGRADEAHRLCVDYPSAS